MNKKIDEKDIHFLSDITTDEEFEMTRKEIITISKNLLGTLSNHSLYCIIQALSRTIWIGLQQLDNKKEAEEWLKGIIYSLEENFNKLSENDFGKINGENNERN